MKNSTIFSIAACAALATGSASAANLFNLAPTLDGEDGSSPLQWTVGASFGYDDNVNNANGTTFAEQDSTFVNAFIEATFANVDARTQYAVSARLGAIYFFDQATTVNNNNVDEFNSDSRFNFRLTHRISDRLRFRHVSHLAYQLQPNFNSGFGANQVQGEFLSWGIDNSIGYEFNPRFGGVFGYRFAGITYDDFSREDRFNHTFYTQGRYKASDRTVLTANYRYLISDNDGVANSTSHIFALGAEHRFSPYSVATINLGAQFRDSDLGVERTSPFLELGVRSQLTPNLNGRVFSRLMQEDGELAAGGGAQYGSRLVWRTGAAASYTFTPEFSVNGGITHIYSDFEDGTAAPTSFSENLINFNLGFAYQVYSNVAVTGSYNFSTSTSDLPLREFDRNRFMLGVQTTF